MWDFSISRAMGLMFRTAPFLLFRIFVYFAIASAYVLATGAGAGIGYGLGGLGDDEFQMQSAVWGGGIFFAMTAGIIYFLREYILYTVKAGHIAVMVELIDGRPLPDGMGQIRYARSVVTQRFGQTSVLFGLDQLIKGVINAVTGLLEGVFSILPIPGLDRLIAVLRAYLKLAVGLVDEAILAHAIRTRSDNPYASAREALILYGQNARPMLINAAWLTLIVYGLSLLVFFVMLAPAAAIVYLIPGAWSAGGVIFALLFAWAVKSAVLEPFAVACLLQAFFKITDGQQPDPSWEARINGASDKFKEIGRRAANWSAGAGARPTFFKEGVKV